MLTHVPFMARIPGGTPNHTVAEPIQLFDILPTILELANITLNHTQFGVSLVEQLYGAPGNPNRTVFSEGGYYW
jgi:choline-sulfatase